MALLERIILQSSKQDDVIFDPFCGCGTTVDAAEKLGRQWVGIDIAHFAVTLIERRIKSINQHAKYEVHGRPTTIAGAIALAQRDKHQFQWWAAWLLGAQTYETKKGGDRGIDGNIFFANGPFGYGRIIISVKGGTNVKPEMVQALNGVVHRENADMGIMVTLVEPTRGMTADAAACGFVDKSAHGRLPKIQIVPIADLLSGRLPKLPALPPPERIHQNRVQKKDKDQYELLLPFGSTEQSDFEPSRVILNSDNIILDPRLMRMG